MKIYLPEGLVEYLQWRLYEDLSVDDIPEKGIYPLRDCLNHPEKMLYPVHLILRHWLYSDYKDKKTKRPKAGIFITHMRKVITGRLTSNIKLLEKYGILDISKSYIPASIDRNGVGRPKTYTLLHPWHTRNLIEYEIPYEEDLDEYQIFMKDCLSKLELNIQQHKLIKEYLTDKYGFRMFKSNSIDALKKEFKSSLYNTIFSKEMWINKLFMILERFNDDNRFNLSRNSGRVYTKISNLPGSFRKHLTLNGNPIIGIDCVNSQPLLLNTIIECGADYKRLCEDGILYEHINDDREKAKKLFIKNFMFAKRHYFETSAYEIKKIFPDIYQQVKDISFSNNNLALQLQKLEAKIWIKGISKSLFENGIEHVTLHDSVYVEEKNIKPTKEFILQIYKKYNLKPTLRLE